MSNKRFCASPINYFPGEAPSLLEVCNSGFVNLNDVKELLRQGAEINEQDKKGRTSLHHLCRHDDGVEMELLRELLNYGAEVNKLDEYGCSALHYLCKNGRIKPEVPRELLNHGAEVNKRDGKGLTPLHYICRSDQLSPSSLHFSSSTEECHINLEFLRELLKHGADVNQLTNDGVSSLHFACRNTEINLEVIKELVHHGSEVNQFCKRGNSPLSNAVVYNTFCNINVVEYLLMCSFSCPRGRRKVVKSAVQDLCKKEKMLPLECAKLFIKYAALENSKFEYDSVLSLSPSNDLILSEFKDKCLVELNHFQCETIGIKRSLYDLLLLGRRAKKFISIKRQDQFLEKILEILTSQKYPIYGGFISFIVPCILDRAKMMDKLENMVNSFVSVNESNILLSNALRIFNFDSLRCIVRYLSDEDVLNFIAAF